MSWIGELWKAGIETDGEQVTIPSLNKAVGRGKTLYVDGTNGTAAGSGRKPKSANLTMAQALAKVTANNNDVIRLIGATTSVAATSITWNKNLTHLIGEYGPGMWNMRSRIEQTVTTTPFMTVSGYGNSFQNLYFMLQAAATDVVGISITGARNSFQRCHFLPQSATAMDDAAFRLVSIDNSETTFRDCTFGGDGANMTNGALVQIGASGDGGPPRTYFENCIFWMDADNAQAAFLDCALAGLGNGVAIFKNCTFINIGTSLTYAILGAGLSNFQLYFDSLCSFAGADDVVVSTSEAYVWFGGINMSINQVNTASSKLFNGLATHPDVS